MVILLYIFLCLGFRLSGRASSFVRSVRSSDLFLRWIKAPNGAWKFGAVNVLAVGGNRMHASMHRPTFSVRKEQQPPPSPPPPPPTKIIPSWENIACKSYASYFISSNFCMWNTYLYRLNGLTTCCHVLCQLADREKETEKSQQQHETEPKATQGQSM